MVLELKVTLYENSISILTTCMSHKLKDIQDKKRKTQNALFIMPCSELSLEQKISHTVIYPSSRKRTSPSRYNKGNKPSWEITIGPLGKLLPSCKHFEEILLFNLIIRVFHVKNYHNNNKRKVHN